MRSAAAFVCGRERARPGASGAFRRADTGCKYSGLEAGLSLSTFACGSDWAAVLLVLPVSIFGLLWMAVAAAWAVALYLRSQRPAWITIGAGARIGLVTGLLGGWMAAAASGVTLFVMRFVLHEGKTIDDTWQTMIADQVAGQWTAAGVDAQTIALYKGWLLSPKGARAQC